MAQNLRDRTDHIAPFVIKQSTPPPAASALSAAERALDGIAKCFREAARPITASVLPTAALLLLRWIGRNKRMFSQTSLGGDSALAISLCDAWESISSQRGEALTQYLSRRSPLGIPPSLPSDKRLGTPRDPEQVAIQYASHLRRVWHHVIALPPECVSGIVEALQQLSTNEDGQAEELLLALLLREGATERSAFYMPQGAIDLMLEIAQPHPGERVYDPCFGSGGLLAGSTARICRNLSSQGDKAALRDAGLQIFGREHYPEYFFVGMVRVLLAGGFGAHLQLDDSLLRPMPSYLAKEGYDCIVACPPWRSVSQRSARSDYPIPASSSEGLFVQHILSHLRPGGRAVIALPESFLFGQREELKIRKWMMEEFKIEGVLGLQPRTFKPYSDGGSGVLLIKRAGRTERVKFFSCQDFDARAEGPRMEGVLIAALEAAERFLYDGRTTEDIWFTSRKDLERRGYDLSVRRTGREGVEQALREIAQAGGDIRVEALGKVFDIYPGANYQRNDVFDVSSSAGDDAIARRFDDALRQLPPEVRERVLAGEPFPMLLRVGDLTAKGISRPKLAIIDGSLIERWSGKGVAEGDLLVSVRGTIGKLAVAGERETGSVPSRGITTLRRKAHVQVDPRFVAALLRSQTYQAWLTGHAAGSTIQNLSLRVIATLPIPLPPLLTQRRVAEAAQEQGVDALSELLRSLTATRADPIAVWLETKAQARRASLQDSKIAGDSALVSLESLESELRSLRNQVAHDSQARSELREWLFKAWEALSPIRGASEVKDGSALYALLVEARATFLNASTAAASSGPGRRLVEEMTARVISQLDATIISLLSKVHVTAAPVAGFVPAGLEAPVTITITNESHLPLRDFRCRVAGFGTEDVYLSYFPVGESTALSVVASKTSEEHIDLEVQWFGRRLDGVRVQGSVPIRIAMQPATAQADVTPIGPDLGDNPYITGTPVDRPNMLFGREDIIASIKRQIVGPDRNHVILLEGNRRAGKTSILWQLERNEELADWLVVKCDFQGAAGPATGNLAGIPTENVFSHLASTIADAGLRNGYQLWLPGQPPPEPNKPFRLEFSRAFRRALRDSPAFEEFKAYLESVLETIRPKRLLLMLDEFDRIQEGIDSGITSPQLPQNLRFILQNYRAVSAILTGSRRMTQMRSDYWSVLFGLGSQVRVTSISQAAAEKLVTSPVEGRLVFSPAAVSRIVRLCARQPFLIQHLASKLFNLCASARQQSVTADMVDEAASDLVRGMEHFEAYWSFAGDERARFLLCLVHRLSQEDASPPVTLPRLEDELERAGISLTRDELLGTELQRLIELELLSMEGEGQYRLAVPLLALWISRNKDCEDQRERAVMESRQRSRT